MKIIYLLPIGILGIVIAALVCFLCIAGCYTVDPGYSSIHMRLGYVIGEYNEPGFHLYYPLLDNVVIMDRRIQKSVIKTEAFSHDLQVIDVEVAINHRIQNPLSIYENIGADYAETVINPYTQESVKATIAQFTAEDLTQQREHAKELVKEDLRNALSNIDIILVDFNFLHVDFHEDFIRSVERKQIAEQRSKQSKFETIRVKEEALQIKERADAEAYSLKVQKEMATPQLALLKAIEKWDGKLPKMITQGVLQAINE